MPARSPLLIGFSAAAGLCLAIGCGSNVTVSEGSPVDGAGAMGGTGAVGGTGGASPTPFTCDDVCAKLPPNACFTSELSTGYCASQCERILAAPDACAAQTEALLTCVVDKGVCSSAAQACLPQLEAWNECSGAFCGGCVYGGGTGWSSASCACLGVPERQWSCSDGGCKCTLWVEPWLEMTPEGACDWPYEG